MYKIISCTLVVVFHVGITLGNPPKYDPITSVPVKCDQCPPGTFVQQDCTAERRTVCASCPPRHFADQWGYHKDCQFCSTVCKELQVVRQECNSTNNRLCECIDGFFLDVEFCLPHKECPPGSGVLQQGTPDSDTVCGECPKGTFSNVTSATTPCQPHTNCKQLRLNVARKGSSTEDTVCQEESTQACDIDVTLCEEALLRFPKLPANWVTVLAGRLSPMAVTSQQIDAIKQRYHSENYLFKLYKSQRKGNDSFKHLIQDINACEMGVQKYIGHLNVTAKHLMALMQSLPGKPIKKEEIKVTLKTCNRASQVPKLLSLWRNKNDGDTIAALRQLKTKQLEKTLRRQMKKLLHFISSVSMYRLYQKIDLEMNGNQAQVVKLEALL
ncbi:tumor necrosis factor receptor superfamily member 11B [Pseudophryne corroboree]|uniref:tumor necrosis factor receptor superfamily member 11B n=1 Tax=Pseudophryne corroboree TaxID=495146 RepID=UPI00308163CC